MTALPPDDSALSEAINDCLEAMRRGESLEDCLSRYPDMADELRHLLTTTQALSGAAPTRDDAARRMAHMRFDGAVRHHLVTRGGSMSGGRSIRQWWQDRTAVVSRVWAVGLASLALLLVLSTGAAYASTDALPDSPLYPVKRATEHARLAITFSDENRAIYHLELIERRSLELAATVEAGDQELAQQLNRDLLKHIEFARLESGYTHGVEALELEADEPTTESQVDTAQAQGIRTRSAEDKARSHVDTAELAERDARLRHYLEAERSTAAHAYATLHIARQIAPPHMSIHINNALTIAEQRYRQTRYVNEPAPLSRTLFAQGVVRVSGTERTIGNALRFEISHRALGNRMPQDGDVVTVGGYVRDDGVLLVVRLFAFESEGVAEDQIWLQAETVGRSEDALIIPGFHVSLQDRSQISEQASEAGEWVYVAGTALREGEVQGEDVHLLGDGPVRFPRP